MTAVPVKIKVTRQDNAKVKRTDVLIDDRVVPFNGNNDCNIYVQSDHLYDLTVVCRGTINASTTIRITRGGDDVISPLSVTVGSQAGIDHGDSQFTVSAQ